MTSKCMPSARVSSSQFAGGRRGFRGYGHDIWSEIVHSSAHDEWEVSRVKISEERLIQTLSGVDAYKYLGIGQLFDTLRKQMRGNKCRGSASSELSARHKVNANNTWAKGLFRYFFPSMRWFRTNLGAVDALSRSFLGNFHCLYGNLASGRLYFPRSEGGRGLSRVRQVCVREVLSINVYLLRTVEVDQHQHLQHWNYSDYGIIIIEF